LIQDKNFPNLILDQFSGGGGQVNRIFKEPTTTALAVDRLVHHSVIIELNLDSYRLETSQKQRPKAHKA
jgi:IstB-like ATP binding protein